MRYYHGGDPITDRVIGTFDDFEGWREGAHPTMGHPTFEDEDQAPTGPPVGVMVRMLPTSHPADVVHPALSDPGSSSRVLRAPTPREPAATAPAAVQGVEEADPDDVPRCRCGARIDDGNHLITMAMWAQGDPRVGTAVR